MELTNGCRDAPWSGHRHSSCRNEVVIFQSECLFHLHLYAAVNLLRREAKLVWRDRILRSTADEADLITAISIASDNMLYWSCSTGPMSSHNRTLRAQRVRIMYSIVLESKLFLYFSPIGKAANCEIRGRDSHKEPGTTPKSRLQSI